LGQVVAGITGPTGVIGGRVNGTYARHNHDTVDDARVRFIGAMGDLVFSPGTGDAKLRPYLLGGLGVQNANIETGIGDNSETNLAFNFGAGVNVAMGSMKLFIEGRWLSVRTDPESANLIPLSIGLRFGGN
jgi:opacity protein-like surface antigen